MKLATVDFIANYALLSLSAFYYFEALMTDFMYSNCYSVGSPLMYCLNPQSKALYPLVGPVGHGYFLGSLATPDGMGIVAGISFLGIGLSILWLRWDKGKRTAILSAIVACAIAFYGLMLGFAYYFPACLIYQCRITNYLPWISYDVGFYLISLTVSIAVFLYYLPSVMRLYRR